MKHQNGNVLFLILIAVVLFAALSYAVTRSSRSGGGDISKEKSRTMAVNIIDFGTDIKNAVTRLKVSNGCQDDGLDFSNPVFLRINNTPIESANPSAPASKKCNIFDSKGGGLAPIRVPAAALDLKHSLYSNPNYYKDGSGQILVMQVQNIGTDGAAGTVSANDVVFTQGTIKKQVCIAINDILHVPNPSGNPPTRTITGSPAEYIGGINSSTGIMTVPSALPAHCGYDAPYDEYYFQQVILER